MADRYPNRPFPADDFARGGDQGGSAAGESDPLAELARLIGQTDPFGPTTGRLANPPPQQRAASPRETYQPAPPPPPQYQPPPAQQYQPPQSQYEDFYQDEEAQPPPGPPSWMQRANLQRQAAARQAPPPVELPYDEPVDEQPSPVHPLHRYAAPSPAQHDSYHQQAYDQGGEHADPSRYDDALYGQLENGAHDFQREPAYPDDPYAYQDGYEDEPGETPKRRGGLVTVAAVLALAVIGTGAAFAYRTYVGSPRSGDPPIIKADNSPTKMPAPTDSSAKTADRMPTGDGTEKLVPREETPVDVNSRAASPRVVFPPLNPNTNPPTAASVSPSTMPAPNAAPGAAPSNGTMPNSEPRRIKTFSVHGDQADPSAVPVAAAPAQQPPAPAKPVPTTRQAAPRNQTQAANAPLSLSPDSAQAALPAAPEPPRTRMAATAPTQAAPPASDAAPAAEGRFLVQISSQTTEAEAQASFRSLQKKYPDQLGSQSPIIRKHDLGDKGVRYRTMVGPFASRDEAARFCTSYKSAGGQCFIP